MREFDQHRMIPIPVPPFRDDADRDAALAASVAVVASQVLGEWPDPARLRSAVDALRDQACECGPNTRCMEHAIAPEVDL